MEHFRGGDYPITPVSLSDFLRHTPAEARAQVQTGAWNIGGNSGLDLSQWAGSESQRSAVDAVSRLSARYWDLRGRADGSTGCVDAVSARLERARQLILEAETSCFLFWGDAWIPHLYERTSQAVKGLEAADAALSALGAETGSLLEPAHPPVDPVSATASRRAQASGARSGGRGRGAATKAPKGAGLKTREHKAAGLRPGSAKTAAPGRKPVRHKAPRRGSTAAAGPGRRGVKRGPRG
jgi:hypothetical protein